MPTTMYAIAASGGKQYRIAEGDTVRVERIDGAVGETIHFDRLLLVRERDGSVAVGDPVVRGRRAAAVVTAHGRAGKVEVVKFRRRKNYRRRMGHRQGYNEALVTGIE